MKPFIGTRLLPLALVFLLVPAACIFSSTTPAPAAQGSAVPSLPADYDCLVGEWELNDFGDSITSMIPPDTTFAYNGTSGRIHWTFIAGGIVEAQADGFALVFTDKQDPSLSVTVSSNGQALRSYILTGPGQLAFSNPDDSNFTYTATVNGIDVDLAPILQGLMPVPPAQGVLSYQCEGNSLTVSNPAAPQMVPLGFSRVTY